MCCDLNAPIFLSQYKVVAVPGDGYCFLHAISMSMKSQLNITHDVSSLLNLLHSEFMSNYDQYLSYLENPCTDTFRDDILNYIGSGIYDTPFGDQVPLIMSNAMKSNIEIVFIVQPSDDSTVCDKVVKVIKNGNHYDALVPHMNRDNSILTHMTNMDDTDNKPTPLDPQCPNISINKNIGNSHRQHRHVAHRKFKASANKQSGFKIAHLNIRSLYHKHDEIKLLLTESNIDVLCLSETWLDSTIPDSQIHIPGYTLECKDRNREGGGVLMYIRHDISYDVRSDIASVSSHVERLWVEVKLSPTLPCLISCMYRPPSSRIEYFNGMLDILDEAIAEDKNIIIPADLNFDYKFDETLCSNPVHQMENLYGMTQIITKPTRVTDKSSTLIDVILTTMPELHTNTEVFEITLSDHFLIYTCINMPCKANHHKTVKYRCYKNFDNDAFLYDLSNSELCNNLITKNGDVEQAWLNWKTEFQRISNKHAPIKESRVKHRHNPWIGSDIIKLMYERKKHACKTVARCGCIISPWEIMSITR